MKKVLQSFALPLLLFATTANAQIFADAVISSGPCQNVSAGSLLLHRACFHLLM